MLSLQNLLILHVQMAYPFLVCRRTFEESRSTPLMPNMPAI